jgi:hypothetical protein
MEELESSGQSGIAKAELFSSIRHRIRAASTLSMLASRQRDPPALSPSGLEKSQLYVEKLLRILAEIVHHQPKVARKRGDIVIECRVGKKLS